MTRDQTVRRRIVGYLTEHGPVVDASGRATSLLKDAVGYEGSDTGFTQLVSAMAKSGALLREVRGKRTYRISLSSSSQPGVIRSSDLQDLREDLMDYDELAAALLARVTRILAVPPDASDSGSWARRRLDQLECVTPRFSATWQGQRLTWRPPFSSVMRCEVSSRPPSTTSRC